MADVIKFRTAKKQVARARKTKQAEENRVRFGRSKSEKASDLEDTKRHHRLVDDHRLTRDDDDVTR